MRDDTPVAGKDFHAETGRDLRPLLPPAVQVVDGKNMVFVMRLSLLKGLDRLPEHGPPAAAFGADEAAGLGRLIRGKWSSRHGP